MTPSRRASLGRRPRLTVVLQGQSPAGFSHVHARGPEARAQSYVVISGFWGSVPSVVIRQPVVGGHGGALSGDPGPGHCMAQSPQVSGALTG